MISMIGGGTTATPLERAGILGWLLLALLMGCGTRAQTGAAATPLAPSVGDTAWQVLPPSARVIYFRSGPAVGERRLAINTERAWDSVWTIIAQGLPASTERPQVDFTSATLLIASGHLRPYNDSMAISATALVGGTLHVLLHTVCRATVVDAVIALVDVVRVPRSEHPVRFDEVLDGCDRGASE